MHLFVKETFGTTIANILVKC